MSSAPLPQSAPDGAAAAPGPTGVPRKVFVDLARWMAGFGLLAGLLFPPFVTLLGVATEQSFTLPFFLAAVLAGLLVAGVNYALTSLVVRPRLRLLAEQMNRVADGISLATFRSDWSQCDPASCHVPVDSADEIGASAQAFNRLVAALMRLREVEAAVSDFSQTLSTQLELQPLASRALDLLLEHGGAQAGAVLLEQDGALVAIARHGLHETQRLTESDHVRRALRTLQIQQIALPQGVAMDALVAERIRHAVTEMTFGDADQGLRVTVSGGVTSYPEDAVEDANELIQHADAALYLAKEGGRNQVRASHLAAT